MRKIVFKYVLDWRRVCELRIFCKSLRVVGFGFQQGEDAHVVWIEVDGVDKGSYKTIIAKIVNTGIYYDDDWQHVGMCSTMTEDGEIVKHLLIKYY